MKYLKTMGIVLTRTNYGEADRIITFLTPEFGKVRALAKGVRKQTSKLAGGIELFSITQLNLVAGRGDIRTLTGTRLIKHYQHISKDLDRTNLGYELLKLLNKTTEDAADPGYFILAENTLAALNDEAIDLDVIRLWMLCRLIRLSGHSPSLKVDVSAKKFQFDFSDMAFKASPQGQLTLNQVKYIILNFGSNLPPVLNRIKDAPSLVQAGLPLANSILQTFAKI